MKPNKLAMLALLTIFMAGVLAAGCDDPSGPGSDGLADTGSRFTVVSMLPIDGEEETFAIDVIQGLCPSGDLEDYYDVFMNVEFELLGGNPNSDVAASGVLIESYRVEYFSSDEGAVALTTQEFVGTNFYISPTGAFVVDGLPLMTAATKNEFILEGGDPALSPIYECRVSFFGVNDYGYEVSAIASTNVILSNYDNC